MEDHKARRFISSFRPPPSSPPPLPHLTPLAMIALIPTVAALATLPLLALGQQSSKTYAPSIVECPADLNIVRHAGVVSVNQTLSPDVSVSMCSLSMSDVRLTPTGSQEDAYIKARRAGVTKEAYAT